MADIDSFQTEKRRFKPSAAFAKQANLSAAEFKKLTALAAKNPDAYWAGRAEELRWMKKWKKHLDGTSTNMFGSVVIPVRHHSLMMKSGGEIMYCIH